MLVTTLGFSKFGNVLFTHYNSFVVAHTDVCGISPIHSVDPKNTKVSKCLLGFTDMGKPLICLLEYM